MQMRSAPRINPYVALVSGIFAVSTGAIFARLADSPAFVTAAYRVGLSTLVILPVACWKVGDELRGLSSKDAKMAVLAGFFLALHFATWISSLDYTSVASSVVLVNTIPIWVGLLSPVITGERAGVATITAMLLSVVGGAIIGTGDFASGDRALLGDLLALAGGICAAFYLLLGRNLRQKLSILAYITVCYGSAAVLLWGFVLCMGLPVMGFSRTTWYALWGMALIAQIVGHSSYNWALKWFSAAMVAVSLLGEPIGATILAYFLFGEGLTLAKIFGGGLILIAICVAAAGESQHR
jgi:drug/metabolite transporter (DMT)-like permease